MESLGADKLGGEAYKPLTMQMIASFHIDSGMTLVVSVNKGFYFKSAFKSAFGRENSSPN